MSSWTLFEISPRLQRDTIYSLTPTHGYRIHTRSVHLNSTYCPQGFIVVVRWRHSKLSNKRNFDGNYILVLIDSIYYWHMWRPYDAKTMEYDYSYMMFFVLKWIRFTAQLVAFNSSRPSDASVICCDDGLSHAWHQAMISISDDSLFIRTMEHNSVEFESTIEYNKLIF